MSNNKNINKSIKWNPVNGLILETEAYESVISNKNILVIAGPGSGKTELLAQRASYLLETNNCKNPKNILAISFKKDSSENLKDRVKERCGKELSRRFVSMTFDAFAKQLLDQFNFSIHEKYRPTTPYSIIDANEVKKTFIQCGINPDIYQSTFNSMYLSNMHSQRLPLSDTLDILYHKVWHNLINEYEDVNSGSKLTFNMISIMVEYLIRTNKYLKNALQMTYSHVFLDEFQDTTSIQYDLLKTCFLNSNTIVTAVGDNKQRIMLWAGARSTIFEDYKNDFSSDSLTLVMNHRSAPRLIELQKLMYGLMNEKEVDLKPNSKWKNTDGEVYLRKFKDHNDEATIVAEEILSLLGEGIKPNDICIIVKQQVDVYGSELIEELSNFGIIARNEAKYQDLLKEEIIKVLISFLKLSLQSVSPDDWYYLYTLVCEINGTDEDTQQEEFHHIALLLQGVIDQFSIKLDGINRDEFSSEVYNIIRQLTYEKFVSVYHKYESTKYFNSLIDQFIELVWDEYCITSDWKNAIDNFEGVNSIPIMTIHKSKGLEYDTVFFLGLEDSAFWNFKKQSQEDRNAFFVALSRAKRRIDFTFSNERPLRYSTKQEHIVIDEFYKMFESSNIVKMIEY